MSAVSGVFEKAAADGRAALIGYLPAGFPSVEGAIAAATAMAEAGADMIEIGLPYTDPLIDGPVIQEAVHRALTGGVRIADVLHTVRALASDGVPVLVMTYWNPVDRYGVDAFARDLAAAGGIRHDHAGSQPRGGRAVAERRGRLRARSSVRGRAELNRRPAGEGGLGMPRVRLRGVGHGGDRRA